MTCDVLLVFYSYTFMKQKEEEKEIFDFHNEKGRKIIRVYSLRNKYYQLLTCCNNTNGDEAIQT